MAGDAHGYPPLGQRSGGKTVIGIVLGLGAAAVQSVAYVFSRLFVQRRDESIVDLMVASHLIIGLACVVLLPFLWPAALPPWRAWIWPLLGTAGFYLAGQVGLFYLMRRIEASRVAPLLALKLVVIAAMTVGLRLGPALSPMQWAAVGLCVAAAFLLNRAGRGLDVRSVGWLAATCLGYSWSDLSIIQLVKALQPLSPLYASVLGACLCYAVCGVAALAAVPFAGDRASRREWVHAWPYAAAWLIGMLLLFGCFAMEGAVFGNILQSTRGVMSVAIGAYAARRGLVRIEAPVDRAIFWRRLAAAVLMTVAIALFHA
jgi:drug/metabolite transporter (DMT)-like permease